MESELVSLESRLDSFLARARRALASRPPVADAVAADLAVDGYAEVLALETAMRRLRRRIDGLAYTELDDLERVRELRAEAAAVSRRLDELRGALAELSRRHP